MGLEAANIVRVGTVSAADSERRRARVWFDDTGMTSGWLFILQHVGADHKYWIPEVGERVWCLYVPVFSGDGIVLGGV